MASHHGSYQAVICQIGFGVPAKGTFEAPVCASQVDHGTDVLTEPKQSEDVTIDRPIKLDPDALDRAVKRRRILDELVHTEEDYISDIRLLLNVYVTMLVSLPSTYPGLRQSVNRNLSDILQLHEECLDELQRAVSHSGIKEFGHLEGVTGIPDQPLHDRTQVFNRSGRANVHRGRSIMESSELCAEPQVIVEVSKIFERQMSRFFIYKEYGAKYEMMVQETASVYDTLPDWDWNQKGLEALSALLSTRSCALRNTNRAATMKDLLVKPIQRICRYPLIFGELLKYTPVADCPNAHMAAESVLARFREATTEINQVTNDPQMRNTLSRSWLLQDRLVFPNRSFDSVSKDRVRSFGHVRLCGTLHVCWQTPDGVDGQYLICILYPDVLCLACAGKVDPIYTIKACINVHEVKIEEADNGRGLQCHTAPFSWKLVFECHHQLFEIIMTACAPKEEVEWRARLSSPLAQCKIGVATTLTFLDLNIKSLGVVTSKSDPGARRLSIRRATTICPKPALYQVIIKNTSGVRQTSSHGSTSLNIHRSHSLLAAKTRVSFLAPPRSERARLEVILADVWSQEILPFSGMSGRSRSERLVRTSASTVIRKLSVASIASSFAKRASGLRQRMSLEDTFRPVGLQTTPSEVADPGSTSNSGNRMSDLEKHKTSTAAAKRSWSQEEIQGTTKKRSGMSGHGFRGMFS
ncbi:RhoGEF domain-containing protein, partial [Metarhizium majus ARSEF 297]